MSHWKDEHRTTYKEHLRVDQEIRVYFRFAELGKRFHSGVVREVHNSHVIVECYGYLWKIGPEKDGDDLFWDHDKRGDLYLTGPFGLHAEKVERLYLYSFTPVYDGRVFIHPNAPDYE